MRNLQWRPNATTHSGGSQLNEQISPMKEPGPALNGTRRFGHAATRGVAGRRSESGEIGVPVSGEAPAADHVQAVSPLVSGRTESQVDFRMESIPAQGLRLTDVPREPVGIRGVSACAAVGALSDDGEAAGSPETAAKAPLHGHSSDQELEVRTPSVHAANIERARARLEPS